MGNYTRKVHFHGDEYRVFCNFPQGVYKSEPMSLSATDQVAQRLNVQAAKAWRAHHLQRRAPVENWIPPQDKRASACVETSNQTEEKLWKFGNYSPDFDNYKLQNGGE